MKLPSGLVFCSFLFYLACSSSAGYRSLQSQNDQLLIRNSELKNEKDSLQLIANELKITKEQLQKTENVLIEFYQKYNDRNLDSNSFKIKDQPGTLDSYSSKIKKLESEVLNLESQNLQLESELQSKNNLLKQYNQSKDLLNTETKDRDSLINLISELRKKQEKAELQINSFIRSEDSLKNDFDELTKMNSKETKEKEYLQFQLNELNAFKKKNDELLLLANTKEKEISNLQIEFDNLNKLNIEIRASLANKERQIEALGLKLSEKSLNDDLQTKNQILKDSIQFYQFKLANQEKDLHEKTKFKSRFDSLTKTLDDSKVIVKSLQRDLSKKEEEINQLKAELKQRTVSAAPVDNSNSKPTLLNNPVKPSLVPTANPKIHGEKSNSVGIIKKIPDSYFSKLTNYFNNHKLNGLARKESDRSFILVYPLESLFEKDRFAVSQSGNNLIEKLTSICKSSKELFFLIRGFDANNNNNTVIETHQIKRANTIAKLLNIYGIRLSNIQVTKSDANVDTYPFTSGIEIIIYAE